MIDYIKMKQTFDNLPKNITVVVCGHKNTDYDSVCSSLALTLFLNKIGITTKMLLKEKDHRFLKWYGNDLNIIESLEGINQYIFISVDLNENYRLGIFEKYLNNALEYINIDHHEGNSTDAKYIFSDSNISSTSEIIYNLISRYTDILDKDIASLLYAGMLADTRCFYQKTDSNTLSVASALATYNIDIPYITEQIALNQGMDEMMVLCDMVSNIKYDKFHYIAISRDKELYQNAEYDTIFKKCVSNIFNINEINVLGVFLKDNEGKVTGLIKSKNDVDVNEIAIKLGGGGHKQASGFENNMSFDEIVNLIKDSLD